MARRLLPFLALACLVGASGVASGAVQRQVVFVEDATVREALGVLSPGETRTLRLDVGDRNLTRLEFHLRWPAQAAALRLEVRGPDGVLAAAPVRAENGVLLVEAGPFNDVPPAANVDPARLPAFLEENAADAGAGEWRVTLRHDEGAGRVDFSLVTVSHRYEAVTMRIVTLDGPAPLDVVTSGPWQLGAAILALAAAILAFVLAGPRPRRKLLPGGDNTASSDSGQIPCAPER